jgi:hypothetical protein
MGKLTMSNWPLTDEQYADLCKLLGMIYPPEKDKIITLVSVIAEDAYQRGYDIGSMRED